MPMQYKDEDLRKAAIAIRWPNTRPTSQPMRQLTQPGKEMNNK